MTEGQLNHMPHLGIVAGTADGAALCYRTLSHEAERLTGGHAYPEITMHALPLEAYLASIDAGDWSGVAALMSRSASVLAQAGAELIICPNNTLHRAFRNEEITFLAPALSKALAQASPDYRVYFHLSHATEQGDEESTSGWLSIRQDTLVLALSEVHDRHGPQPDISKYDRQMPNVPERSSAFDVIFEPEEYLIKVKSGGKLFSPDQREELYIKYREALSALPRFPGLEPRLTNKP